jgi:hypothetical protein
MQEPRNSSLALTPRFRGGDKQGDVLELGSQRSIGVRRAAVASAIGAPDARRSAG